MSSIRAALVDMDGTLVDTRVANYRAYAQAFEEAGVTVSEEVFHDAAFGKSWRQFVPALLLLAESSADAEIIARRKGEIYPTLMHETVLNSALVRLLRYMKSDCKIALVTTAASKNARAVLSFHGLVDLFDEIITGDDVKKHKPHPEAYRLAAQRMGIEPHEAIVFEDSAVGIESAIAFGADVCPIGAIPEYDKKGDRLA